MPDSYYTYWAMIRQSRNPHNIRLDMVLYAQKYSNKKAAMVFNTSEKTVAKWRKRFEQQGINGLFDRSRRPKSSPNAIDEKTKLWIIYLRKLYPRISAETIKRLESVPVSPRTMRKIWREAGLSNRIVKKHVKKRNLRHIKQKLKLFQLCMEDTKDLSDIPNYYKFMEKYKLPRYQYSFREVSTGAVILGFSNTLSLAASTIFAQYVNACLSISNVKFDSDLDYIRQTDNGSEYIGSVLAKRKSSYTLEVEKAGFKHHRIIPKAYTMQADIETLHGIIEREFYDIEKFSSREDFMGKVYSYQLFFNLARTNTYKENKTPYELAKEKEPNINPLFFCLPPIDLDSAMSQLYNQTISQWNDVHAKLCY